MMQRWKCNGLMEPRGKKWVTFSRRGCAHDMVYYNTPIEAARALAALGKGPGAKDVRHG